MMRNFDLQSMALATMIATGAVGLALIALSIAGAPAAAKDDASVGKGYARANCTYCHVISDDQEFTPPLQPHGPKFTAIAAKAKNTPARLTTFLMMTHHDFRNAKGMPNPLLTNDQISDVVAYIVSLRKPPA